jgi:hypothetical protein
LSFDATFAVKDKTPWQWDPETGKRDALTVSTSGNIPIQLRPLESLVLVFEPNMVVKKDVNSIEANLGGESFEIKGPWRTIFEHVNGNTLEVSLDQLQDLSTNIDNRLATFAGTITYAKTFSTNEKTYSSIDLGTVHGVSEVTLNNVSLGVRWWGRHEYSLKGLKRGQNMIKIKVATVLCNYCKSIDDNPVATLWTQDQNVRPIGLIGPVRLK